MAGTRLFSEGPSHWYTKDGKAQHTVLGRDGQERATTLSDARRLGLLPSVTNVLGIINKPAVTAWRLTGLLTAAQRNPAPVNGETDAEWAARVAAIADKGTREASEFGTAFHKAAEVVAQSPLDVDPGSGIAPFVRQYRDWFLEKCSRVMFTESSVMDPGMGYAGTADLCIVHKEYGLMLVDIKTQRIEKGGKPRFYPTWLYQLAAYRSALKLEAGLMNVVVNSAYPEPVIEHAWSAEQGRTGWGAFRAAMFLWCMEKNYKPGNGTDVESGLVEAR